MNTLPQSIEERTQLDSRLGIKSSLSKLSSVVALSYALYCANSKKASVVYSDEIEEQNRRYLVLKPVLANSISELYNVEVGKLNKNPLLQSQLEALQVGMSLMLKIGVVRFVEFPNTDTKERTGSNRYSKEICFSVNMGIIDLYISSWSEDIQRNELRLWLYNTPSDSQFSSGLKQILTIFSEDTLFKLRANNQEVIFQQEGIYKEILNGNNVIAKDAIEDVGPFRVFKSFVREKLHPYLQITANEFSLKKEEGFQDYNNLVQTGLLLSPKKDVINTGILENESNQQSRSEFISNKNFEHPYRQYVTAIKSKPFLLLAGISGTGKSRIVRELARSCWEEGSEEYKAQKPRNFEMVQVKPNWHDSSELIGYVSRINGEQFAIGPFLKFMVKAMQEPDVPYFLCLDEMNLAPVEQYLAEYLSVIESRKLTEDGTIVTDPIIAYDDSEAYHSLIAQLFPKDDKIRELYLKKEQGKRLTIPQNLIVVGTVNMDETTFSFSRKVLDRAMTIEMNEVDLMSGLRNRYEPIGKQSCDTLIGNTVEGIDVYESRKDVCDICLGYLNEVNTILEGTPFKVAYRTRNEVLLYVVNNLPYNETADGEILSQEYVIARALDEITNMKILSRIEGDEAKVSLHFLDRLATTIKDELSSISSLQYGANTKQTEEEQIEKSISIAKLEEMKNRLRNSGYTSFWS